MSSEPYGLKNPAMTDAVKAVRKLGMRAVGHYTDRELELVLTAALPFLWEPFIYQKVDSGHMTVRLAAELLGKTMDDVQEAIWGEVRL